MVPTFVPDVVPLEPWHKTSWSIRWTTLLPWLLSPPLLQSHPLTRLAVPIILSLIRTGGNMPLSLHLNMMMHLLRLGLRVSGSILCLLYTDNSQGTGPCQSSANGFQGALISIGPETDAVIDRFGLNDNLVPRLRVLTCKILSSRWETVLRTPNWGLSYEQSTNLAKAMQADICGHQSQAIQVFASLFSEFSWWLTLMD